MKARASLIALLASFFLILPGISSTKSPKPSEDAKKQAKLFQKKLNKDEQVLHALDRLTFGPKPGDVEKVKKMGLKKWIDLQLHPERIPENPDLEAKLQPLESLRMTPMETVQHYPPPQLIRAIAQGRQPLPEDPALRASVERLIARYKVRQEAAAGDADGGKSAKQVAKAVIADPNAEMEPAKP